MRVCDDRPKVRSGVKFTDAELIGVPTLGTVGRGLAGIVNSGRSPKAGLIESS